MYSKDTHKLLFPAFYTAPAAATQPCSDVDGNGYISASELGNLFREVGFPLPGYQIRELMQKLDRNNDSQISIQEFAAVGNTN